MTGQSTATVYQQILNVCQTRCTIWKCCHHAVLKFQCCSEGLLFNTKHLSSHPELPCHAAGDYRTQFHVKAEKIAEALSAGQYDFGFLHIKAVDDTGHDQQPVLKVCGHIGLVPSSMHNPKPAYNSASAICMLQHACSVVFLLQLAAPQCQHTAA